MLPVSGFSTCVGFEDNVYLLKGVPAEENAHRVENAAKLANLLGRDVVSCQDLRQILHIKD